MTETTLFAPLCVPLEVALDAAIEAAAEAVLEDSRGTHLPMPTRQWAASRAAMWSGVAPAGAAGRTTGKAPDTATDTAPSTSARIYPWRSGPGVPRWPTESATLTLSQLSLQCGIEEDDLLDLVDHGVLDPCDADSAAEPWRFSADCIVNLRRAERMRQDLALDDHGFALVVMCLERISGLEAGLHRLRSEIRHLSVEG